MRPIAPVRVLRSLGIATVAVGLLACGGDDDDSAAASAAVDGVIVERVGDYSHLARRPRLRPSRAVGRRPPTGAVLAHVRRVRRRGARRARRPQPRARRRLDRPRPRQHRRRPGRRRRAGGGPQGDRLGRCPTFPNPVEAVAWGVRLPLESADDPRARGVRRRRSSTRAPGRRPACPADRSVRRRTRRRCPPPDKLVGVLQRRRSRSGPTARPPRRISGQRAGTARHRPTRPTSPPVASRRAAASHRSPIAADIARFAAAGAAARRVLDRVAAEVGPGVTTDHLDAVAHEAYLDEGGYPSHARLPRLPEEPLHVGQRGRRPRHPRRPSARRGRHRQLRRHHLPRRHARRLLPHRLRGRRRRRRPERTRRARRHHRGGAPGRHRRGPARAAGCATSAGPSRRVADRHGFGMVRELGRPRHRRAVPRRAPRPPLRRAPQPRPCSARA